MINICHSRGSKKHILLFDLQERGFAWRSIDLRNANTGVARWKMNKKTTRIRFNEFGHVEQSCIICLRSINRITPALQPNTDTLFSSINPTIHFRANVRRQILINRQPINPPKLFINYVYRLFFDIKQIASAISRPRVINNREICLAWRTTGYERGKRAENKARVFENISVGNWSVDNCYCAFKLTARRSGITAHHALAFRWQLHNVTPESFVSFAAGRGNNTIASNANRFVGLFALRKRIRLNPSLTEQLER